VIYENSFAIDGGDQQVSGEASYTYDKWKGMRARIAI
jgi:hypothetical protein